MTTNLQRHWSAFHIFLHDSEQQEAFIQQWLTTKAKAVMAAKQAESWFFLRYWDGGPHLRVRFLNLQNEAELLAEISAAAQNFKTSQPLSAETYYANHSFDGAPVEVADLEWHDDGEVEMYPYEPEYARYGGSEALKVNEELFYVSSEIAVAIINATQGKIEHRLQLSLKFIICSIFSANTDTQALQQFATYYAEFWRSHAAGVNYAANPNGDPQLLQSIESFKQETINDTAGGAIGTWVKLLKQSIARFHKIYEDGALNSPLDGAKVQSEEQFQMTVMSMIGSQIHMLNNRLGVTPAYEFVLSSRIRDALSVNAG